MNSASSPENAADPAGGGHRVRRLLGIARDGFPFIGIAATPALLLGLAGVPTACLLASVLPLFVAWFFRDPERNAPADTAAVVSPADGKVLDVVSAPYPRLLSGEATRVSIFMSVFNVHVNRIPFGGTVRAVHRNPGRFFAAYAEKASLENEQTAVAVDTGRGAPILFVQIAGWIARRIVCRLSPGERVERGERFGLIRFGSRCDVFLPPSVEVTVRPGERVAAGKSVLGVFR